MSHAQPLSGFITLILFLLTITSQSFARVEVEPETRKQGLEGQGLFIENKGQWDRRVRFAYFAAGQNIWITDRAIVFDYHVNQATPDIRPTNRSPKMVAEQPLNADAHRREGHVVRMYVANGPSVRVEGMEKQTAYCNYFKGNDPGAWQRKVACYRKVLLNNIAEGVSLQLYESEGGLRYDIFVEPGADPSQLGLTIEGANSCRISQDGALHLTIDHGVVVHDRLFVYQVREGAAQPIPAEFSLHNSTIGFRIGSYDKSLPLVIDPLINGTLVGGAARETIVGMAVSAPGEVLAAGTTQADDFPRTVGAYRTSHSANEDAFVVKFSDYGATLVFASIFGGEAADVCQGMALDSQGNIVIAGQTLSSNLPTTPGVFQENLAASSDGFVAKLSGDGSTLMSASYVGAEDADLPYALAVDERDNVYVAGVTRSEEFPTTPDAFASASGGHNDAFVSKFNPSLSGLIYSTFIGGTDHDFARKICLGAEGELLIAGGTRSLDFPATNSSYIDPAKNNELVFVCKLNAAGSALAYSIPFGGEGYNIVHDLAIDKDGAPIAVGHTLAAGFPLKGVKNSRLRGSKGAFVAAIASDGTDIGASLIFRASGRDEARGLAIGSDGSIYVVGQTDSPVFPFTNGSFDPGHNGNSDGFLVRLTSDLSDILYATFIGGSERDEARLVALDAEDIVYVGGSTSSGDFPPFPSPYSNQLHGLEDAYLAAFDIQDVRIQACDLRVTLPDDTSVCDGVEVTLQPRVVGGSGYLTYSWAPGYIFSDPSQAVQQFKPRAFGQPYALVVTDESGCTASTTVNISVKPVRVGTTVDNASVCSHESRVLDPQFISEGSVDFDVRWEPADGLSDPFSFRPMFRSETTSATTQNYTIVVTADNGCSRRLSFSVAVTPAPQVAFSQSSLKFGHLRQGQSFSSASISLRNEGTRAVTVASITLVSPFRIVNPTLPFTLQAKESRPLSLAFEPTEAGRYENDMTLLLEPCEKSLRLPLIGRYLDDEVAARNARPSLPRFRILGSQTIPDILRIEYQARSAGSARLSIRDVVGRLYAEVPVRGIPGLIQTLEIDLSRLPMGAYFLLVDKQREMRAAPFLVLR